MNEKVKEILDELARWHPTRIATIHSEIERLEASVNHTACHDEGRLLHQKIERLEQERDDARAELGEHCATDHEIGEYWQDRLAEKDKRIAELEGREVAWHEMEAKYAAALTRVAELEANNKFLSEAVDAAIKDREYFEALSRKESK